MTSGDRPAGVRCGVASPVEARLLRTLNPPASTTSRSLNELVGDRRIDGEVGGNTRGGLGCLTRGGVTL